MSEQFDDPTRTSETKTTGAGGKTSTLLQVAEVAIILCAVFGADIALARVVDVALDAIYGSAGR